jgi:hypothetical protein
MFTPICTKISNPRFRKVSIISLTITGSEELVPDQSSEGWKSDAHKNLPGFKELHRQFPDAKWYIMIDDDSYVLRHNLANFLRQYDHNTNLYFGAETKFTGCGKSLVIN